MLVALQATAAAAVCANPIVPGVGMADPHIHVWPAQPTKLYGYMTHDCSKSEPGPLRGAATTGRARFSDDIVVGVVVG